MPASSRFPSFRLALKVLCLLALTSLAAPAQEVLNGDFKGPFLPVKVPDGSNAKAKVEGKIAAGWRDESAWGEVAVAYSQDPTGGKDGLPAQKIEVTSVTKGSVQFVQELKFAAGTVYHVTAWIRAAAPGEISVQVRQSGAPYTTYGIVKAPLTTEWSQVEVSGTATTTDNGLIMFVLSGPGTYWIAGVTLTTGS